MTAIVFGIGLRRMRHIAEDARIAEQLGYAFVCAGEHVFFHGPIGNGLIQLAAAAGATERIGLMSAITLVPLYPPALLAKQVTTLDVVSNGRFSLGVGVGGEYPKEFAASGIPVRERGARTDEALEVLKRLSTGEAVSFDGRFVQLDAVTLAPGPVQLPHPPIWISGRSEAAMRRCARYGDGWLPYMYTPEMLRNSLAQITKYAAELDRPAPNAGQYLFFAVHEDRDTAVRMAAERLSKQYQQDFSERVHRYALAGNPDDCIARLREYVDAGARTILVNSACPADYMASNEQLFADAVLPAFS